MTSDYDGADYDFAKRQEGGLHTGRQTPSRGLLFAAMAAMAALIGGMLAIGLLMK